MGMTPDQCRDFVLRHFYDDDSLERAEAAFRSRSPEDMQKQYGQSGRTCQQILDEYRAARKLYDEATAWLKSVQP
jgi:hypothetical protein